MRSNLSPALNAPTWLTLAMAAVLAAGCAAPQPTSRVIFSGLAVNGKPAHLFLDTGSDSMVLLGSEAARLELKTAASVPDISINGQSGQTLALSEPAGLTSASENFTAQLPVFTLPRYLSSDNFGGFVGWPEVRDNILVFDSERRTVSRAEQVPEAAAGWLRLNVRRRNVLIMSIRLADGTMGNILVDTGDSFGVGLPPAKWKEWKAAHPNAPVVTRHYSMVGSTELKHEETWADEISFGALSLTDVPLHEESAAIDGLVASLGLYALARMDLVVDAKNGAAYAHPKPPPGPPYPGFTRPNDAGTSVEKNGNWTAAENVKFDPRPLRLYSIRSKITLKDYDGAIADCDRALEPDPNDSDVHALRGSARIAKGEVSGAAADFELAVHDNPGSREAFADRAVIRQIQGDLQGAVADYDQAIALQRGGSAHLQTRRQILQLQLGTAPADFAPEVARMKLPWAEAIGEYLTGKLTEQGLLAKAEKSKAQQVSARKCSAHYFIGMMKLIHGDKNGARADWGKCLATGESNDENFWLARAELARLDAGTAKR